MRRRKKSAPPRRKKSYNQLHKIFLKRHWEWEAANNPQGIDSGERDRTWNARMKALMALVRAGRRKDKKKSATVAKNMAYETLPPKEMPEPGYYYHYKHDPQKGVGDYAYYIYGVGHHTEDDCRSEDRFMQVYRPLYKAFVYTHGKMFDLRPLSMFYEPAVWQGKEVPRFTRIEDPAVIKELQEIKRWMYPEE